MKRYLIYTTNVCDEPCDCRAHAKEDGDGEWCKASDVADLEAVFQTMELRKRRLHVATVTDEHIKRAETLIACGLDVEQVSQMLAEHDADRAMVLSLHEAFEKAKP